MTIEEITTYLGYLSPLLACTGFIYGLMYFKKLSGFYKSLTIFLGLMFFIDRTFSVCAGILGYNYIIQPYYALIEITFFIFLYHTYMLSKKYKLILFLEVVACGYILCEILYFTLVPTTAAEFQSYAKPIDNFIVIILTLLYLYEKVNAFDASKFKYLKFNTIALIYFSLSTFIFLPFNFLINQSTSIIFIFMFVNIMSILMFYSFIVYNIIKHSRTRPVIVKK